MKKDPTIAPIKQDNGKLKEDEKQARLAEALRANLRRRKEQSRDRRNAPDTPGTPDKG